MDSSTTDVCEWCKRPMLPPGAKVTSRPPAGGDELPEPDAPADAPEAEVPGAAPPPAEPPPLLAQPPEPQPPQEETAPPGPASVTQAANPVGDDVLRPLGQQTPSASAAGGDPNALSVDLSQYVGEDQSIFRPVEKPTAKVGSIGQAEGFAARKRAAIEREQGKEIPENVRLTRSAIAGGLVAFLVTMVRYGIHKEVPTQLLVINIGAASMTFAGALMYAGLLALLLGFMMGALLTKFKLGPVPGLFIGLVLGFAAIGDKPWGLIAGALAGILGGVFASKGARRVINV